MKNGRELKRKLAEYLGIAPAFLSIAWRSGRPLVKIYVGSKSRDDKVKDCRRWRGKVDEAMSLFGFEDWDTIVEWGVKIVLRHDGD